MVPRGFALLQELHPKACKLACRWSWLVLQALLGWQALGYATLTLHGMLTLKSRSCSKTLDFVLAVEQEQVDGQGAVGFNPLHSILVQSLEHVSEVYNVGMRDRDLLTWPGKDWCTNNRSPEVCRAGL